MLVPTCLLFDTTLLCRIFSVFMTQQPENSLTSFEGSSASGRGISYRSGKAVMVKSAASKFRCGRSWTRVNWGGCGNRLRTGKLELTSKDSDRIFYVQSITYLRVTSRCRCGRVSYYGVSSLTPRGRVG